MSLVKLIKLDCEIRAIRSISENELLLFWSKINTKIPTFRIKILSNIIYYRGLHEKIYIRSFLPTNEEYTNVQNLMKYLSIDSYELS